VPQWLDKAGTGRGDGWRAGVAGVTAWVWCPRADGLWDLRWGAATAGDLAAMAVDAPTLMLAPDKLAAARTLADKHIGRNIDDPELLPLWCPHWAAMHAAMPAPLTVERWVVAKAPSNANPAGTRPLYHYTGGVLVNAQQRIAEATACNAAVPRLVLDKITYCAPATATTVYAVAVRLP
jgi:hypothetical protein